MATYTTTKFTPARAQMELEAREAIQRAHLAAAYRREAEELSEIELLLGLNREPRNPYEIGVEGEMSPEDLVAACAQAQDRASSSSREDEIDCFWDERVPANAPNWRS